MAAFDLSEVDSILKEIDNTVLCSSSAERQDSRGKEGHALSKTVVSGSVSFEMEGSAPESNKTMAWQFCSEQEGLDRERMLDIHILEATDESKGLDIERRKIDPYRAVRKFVRSSGDVDLKKYPIRSIAQMKGSIEYLLHLFINTHVVCNANKDKSADDIMLGTCYTFCMNRLNALRQEFTIEQIEPAKMIVLLQLVCKFYIVLDTLCMPYHISATQAALLPGTAHWFDPVMHTSTMMSALGTTISVFKDLTNDEIDNEGLFDIQTETLTFHLFMRLSISLNNAISKAVSIHESMQMQIKEAVNAVFHPIKFHDILMPFDSHIEMDKCSHEQHRLFEYVWNLVASIKNGNPARAIKTINGLLQAFPCTGAFDSTIMERSSLLMAKLSRHLLPYLIVWRLLLMDLAANKRESVQVDAISERIPIDASILSIERRRILIKMYFESDMDDSGKGESENEEKEDVVRLRDITYSQVKADKKKSEVMESTLRAKVEQIRLGLLE